jgi:hypothetical protein
MKTLYLLFMMLIWVALLRGACYADPPAAVSELPHSKNSDATVGNPPDNITQAALVNDGKHQMEAKPLDRKQDDHHASHRQERPTGTVGAVSGEILKMDDTSRRPARSTALVPLGGTSFNKGHNRSSAPAVIGGPAYSVKSMAAINGIGMNRKP